MKHGQRILAVAWLAVATGSGQAATLGPRYDFDGDRRADVAVYHRQSGTWYIQQSGSAGLLRQRVWGDRNGTPVPGDYDKDGKTDLAVFYRQTGEWSILQSGTITPHSEFWGDPDGMPVPGDYDGDGKTDLAVFYRSTGEWLIRHSSTGAGRSLILGGADARPVPADYDGDGKTDPAFYRPGLATWQILESAANRTRVVNIGRAEARPVAGDFDGDRKDDVAVYYPRLGQWQIVDSSSGLMRTLYVGGLQKVAVPGDFDGDGRTDIATYNPPLGKWRITQSSSGVVRVENFGALMARPIPAYAQGAIDNLRIHSHGDSITYGQDSSTDGPASGYPIYLEEFLEGSYGGDLTSLNYGDPGETTGTGRQRLVTDLASSKARVLLIMEGTNDHYYKKPFDEIENNLRSMVQSGLSRGMFVVIATIPPVIPSQRPDQYQRIRDFNPRIYEIAGDFQIPVAQVYEYMTLWPGWEINLMDQGSGVHPNDAGYAYVRLAFQLALAPALANGEIY